MPAALPLPGLPSCRYESYPAFALAKGLISQAQYSRVQESVAGCKLLSALCSGLDPAACEPASSTCEYKVWRVCCRCCMPCVLALPQQDTSAHSTLLPEVVGIACCHRASSRLRCGRRHAACFAPPPCGC